MQVVSTGAVTTVDARLQVGEQKDTVTVETVNPQIEVESHTIETRRGHVQVDQLEQGLDVGGARRAVHDRDRQRARR